MSLYRYCFFDLDGTLTNSAPGIIASVRYAMQKLGKAIPHDMDLTCFIGPPLLDGFSKFFGLSMEDSARAVAYYRENYRAGALLDCLIYDGIRDALEALNKCGVVCALATCKPREFALRILEHYDMRRYFAFVSGPELDGTRNEKHEVIAYAMEQLGIPDASSVLMVGDRRDDVVGATRNGVDCLGVLWGFGTREELLEAGATALLKTPIEIMHFFEQKHTKK